MSEILAGWRAHRVVCFNGSSDTKKYSGQDYASLTLDQVFSMEPGNDEKMDALAIIPSSYCGSDARTHEVQRERGQYVALALDIDKGSPSMNVVAGAIQSFAGGDVAALIYSSSSASTEAQKWRGIIPLASAVAFVQWQELQHALFRHFEQETGLKPDYALDRAGQPVYMPNVPPARRDVLGEPEFYQRLVFDGDGLKPSSGKVKAVVMALRQERAAMDADHAARRDRAREAVMARTMGKGDGDSALDIIKRFNDGNSISDLLRANAYDQKGRSDDWRSPYQSSGSYATRDFGTHWVSLSESDASAGLGRQTSGSASQCFGDAFDLFCHFDHGNDFKSAIKALAAGERKDRRDDMARFEPVASAGEDFAQFIGAQDEEAAVQEAGSAADDFAAFINQSSVDADDADQSSRSVAMTGSAAALQRAMQRMDAASLEELTGEVPRFVERLQGIDQMGLSALASHYKKSMKRVGVTISINDARAIIKNKPLKDAEREQAELARASFKASAETSEMLRDWVYLEQSERFVNLRDGRELSSKSFDMIYAADIPVSPDEDYPKAASRFFSLSEGRMVYAQMYVPAMWRDAAGGQFFEHERKHYLNSYSGSATPAIDEGWRDREHWSVINDHMHKLMGNAHEADLMIKWMAHNVQHPGTKILWAPVVYGPQGSGKTTIERIMSAAMGQANVRTISMDEVYSTFTSWAEGACVRFIEEIRVIGHSRHDLMNKLKPYITNERIKVVKKGQDGLDALNTQNYACFTNFGDAIPIDSEDRRYGVFSTAARTREDVVAMFNQDYWSRLYGSINGHPGDVRAWLMSIDLNGFDRIAAPPMTRAKMDMIEATRSDDVINLEMVIEAGGLGVSCDAVSQSHVNGALRAAGFSSLMGRRLRKCLDELGFVQVPWVVKFDGKTCRISVRGDVAQKLSTLPESHRSMFNSEIKAKLQASEF